jgi:hypothetical protein
MCLLVCDFCREEFTAVIPNPPLGFDPKTAAAICSPCAQEMCGVYEFERSE